jgi:hypothetical protein
MKVPTEVKSYHTPPQTPLMTELDEYLDDVTFKEDESAGSCKIENI